jgi:hypothetical protein
VGVAGYNLCWGTNSRQFGPYLYTNYYPKRETNATILDLATNEIYYVAVQTVSSNESFSAFSNEEIYTNGIMASTSDIPPVPPGGGSTNGTTNAPVLGGTGNGGSNIIAQATLWGIPPVLGLAVSHGQASLTISSTVGATLTIMGSTGDLSSQQWSALTNVTVTNIASIAETNQNGQLEDMLDVAFVPGTVTLPMGGTQAAPFQYFKAVMPYDYVILADQVLSGKTNYTPRLILVNMPGIVADDACYVNEASSFIHCAHSTFVLQLVTSGSTIRQIASTLASSLNLDWTSASEFTYSNGLGQLLATVIETEPPSSDPVAGQTPPGAPIVINF